MIDEQLMNVPLNQNSTNPKELFEVNDIEGKTELNSEQVMIISRMKILGDRLKKVYGITSVNDLIDNFLKLQVSKDRKSRNEFVSAFQSRNDERIGGLMDKVGLNMLK